MLNTGGCDYLGHTRSAAAQPHIHPIRQYISLLFQVKVWFQNRRIKWRKQNMQQNKLEVLRASQQGGVMFVKAESELQPSLPPPAGGVQQPPGPAPPSPLQRL